MCAIVIETFSFLAIVGIFFRLNCIAAFLNHVFHFDSSSSLTLPPVDGSEVPLGGGLSHGGSAAGDVGQEGRVPAGRGRVRRRPRQRVALPLHLLSERRRYVYMDIIIYMQEYFIYWDSKKCHNIIDKKY